MSTSPSPNGSNGRLVNGKFGQGNDFGKGNPFAKRAAELRSVLYDSVTDDDMKAVVVKVIELAKSGDLAAMKLLMDRVLGKVAVDQDERAPRIGSEAERRIRMAETANRVRERNGTDAGLPGDDGSGSPENFAVIKLLLLERFRHLDGGMTVEERRRSIRKICLAAVESGQTEQLEAAGTGDVARDRDEVAPA
jgi:hypothetical protein